MYILFPFFVFFNPSSFFFSCFYILFTRFYLFHLFTVDFCNFVFSFAVQMCEKETTAAGAPQGPAYRVAALETGEVGPSCNTAEEVQVSARTYALVCILSYFNVGIVYCIVCRSSVVRC